MSSPRKGVHQHVNIHKYLFFSLVHAALVGVTQNHGVFSHPNFPVHLQGKSNSGLNPGSTSCTLRRISEPAEVHFALGSVPGTLLQTGGPSRMARL